MTAAITVDITPGELIDKITILEIKTQRIREPAKLRNIRKELALLTQAREKAIPASAELERLTAELRRANTPSALLRLVEGWLRADLAR